MTTPARDTVRATYRRMESAVEPSRKVCCVCGVVLVEGTGPTSHGYCREDEVEMYGKLAGRVSKLIPPKSRPAVAYKMRVAYRTARAWGMDRASAQVMAEHVRHAANIAAFDAAERTRGLA